MPASRFASFGVLIALLLMSCVTTSDVFLIKNLDDTAKSRALTEKGITEYRTHLIDRNDHTMVAEVLAWFENAIRIDPANTRAELYLNRIRAYKTDFVNARVQEARSLLAKANRSEIEDYQLLFAVRRALDADPSNKEASKMLQDTRSLRDLTVARLMDRSRRAWNKVGKDMSSSEKETLYVEALSTTNRALAIDPDNRTVRSWRDQIQLPLKTIVDDIVKAAYDLKSRDQFTNALRQADRIKAINAQTLSAFKQAEESLRFNLYYDWALGLERNRRYAAALEKIEAALDVRRTDEAIEARRRIAIAWRAPVAAKPAPRPAPRPAPKPAPRPAPKPAAAESAPAAAPEPEVNPDELLSELEGSLAYLDMTQVKSILAEVEKLNLTRDQRERIASYRTRSVALVKEQYEKGLAAYREEDYRRAIESFSVVVAWDSRWEQAADYLARSREKQTLIDQFSL